MDKLCTLAVLGALAGCGSDGMVDAIEAFTSEDLIRARSIAVDAGDSVAAGCYAALLETARAAPKRSNTDIGKTGAFSVFQMTRNISRRFDGAVSEKVHVACAPLIVDAQATLIGLSAIGAK